MTKFNENIVLKITTVEEKLYALMSIARALKQPLEALIKCGDEGALNPLLESLFNDKVYSVKYRFISLQNEKIAIRTAALHGQTVYFYGSLDTFLKALVPPEPIKVQLTSCRSAEVTPAGVTLLGYEIPFEAVEALAAAVKRMRDATK